MKTVQIRCLRAAASISDIEHVKLTESFTAASLETDSGWFPRQSEYVVFLRKYSERVKSLKTYKNIFWLRCWEILCSLPSNS